jgi:hypothetical protein
MNRSGRSLRGEVAPPGETPTLLARYIQSRRASSRAVRASAAAVLMRSSP